MAVRSATTARESSMPARLRPTQPRFFFSTAAAPPQRDKSHRSECVRQKYHCTRLSAATVRISPLRRDEVHPVPRPTQTAASRFISSTFRHHKSRRLRMRLLPPLRMSYLLSTMTDRLSPLTFREYFRAQLQ